MGHVRFILILAAVLVAAALTVLAGSALLHVSTGSGAAVIAIVALVALAARLVLARK